MKFFETFEKEQSFLETNTIYHTRQDEAGFQDLQAPESWQLLITDRGKLILWLDMNQSSIQFQSNLTFVN